MRASCTAIQRDATGGIVGKNVYGGKITNCWTDNSLIYGSTDDWSTMTNCLTSVNGDTEAAAFTGIGLDSNWYIVKGLNTSPDMEKCYYNAF